MESSPPRSRVKGLPAGPTQGEQVVTPPNAPRSLDCDAKRVAVLVAAHGDRGGQSNPHRNQTVLSLARGVGARLAPLPIAVGLLKGTPSIEDAIEGIDASHLDRVIVYPFFMADGYFVRKVLPERLKQAAVRCPVHICAPLGLDRGLPPLIAAHVTAAARTAGRDTKSSRLLLVGHGSKFGPASANATRQTAKLIAAHAPDAFAAIDVAFLEEAPFLAAALQESPLPTLVSGFFNGDGMHAGEDVPDALAETQSDAMYCGPVGSYAGVQQLMAAAIQSACATRPEPDIGADPR